MNKIKLKNSFSRQKNIYKVLLIIVVFAILIGIMYPLFLNKDNHVLLNNSIIEFIDDIKNNNINTFSSIKNTAFSNILFCISLFLLGISIIGIPIIVFLIIYKSFILGFTFSSFIRILGFKGIIGSIIYTFPCLFLILILSILLGFYGIRFSYNLFKYLFFKNSINLKYYVNRYLKIFCICLAGFIIVSLLQVYMIPYFLRLFTLII